MPNRVNGASALRSVDLFPGADDMTADQTTARLFDKLDGIQSSQATTSADVARIQGALTGMQSAINTVSSAIGDVTETKITAAAMTVTIAALAERLAICERKANEKDTRTWVEGLVKFAVAGLTGGGVAALAQHWMH
jgi:hypothetical protein